jgi:hypothetical protein
MDALRNLFGALGPMGQFCAAEKSPLDGVNRHRREACTASRKSRVATVLRARRSGEQCSIGFQPGSSYHKRCFPDFCRFFLVTTDTDNRQLDN